MRFEDTIIVIPSRIDSKRIFQKPLQIINGATLIEHVVKNIQKFNLCDIAVATDSECIANIVNKCGCSAFLTDSNLCSGTDRVYQALQKMNKTYKFIINLQGDILNCDSQTILSVIEKLHYNHTVDVITVIFKTEDYKLKNKKQFVKTSVSYDKNIDLYKCLYFSRADIPFGSSEKYIHIGVYGYQLDSLKKFANLPMSNLEKIEKLEQLRCLENNMQIYAIVSDKLPISIDVMEDIERAQKIIEL